jgi:hypothetical protein
MADDFKALIEEQKETNKKLGQLVSSSSNEPSGAAAKEEQQESAAADKNQTNLLKKIAGGVSGMFGNMMKPVKGAGKGIMAMLKGTLVAGLLLAVMAFLESKYWTDTKDFIVNKVVPMLVDFYENILKPIGVIFADFFVATWENIKTLFSGLGESFDLFANGEWWEGIKTMVTSIGTFLGTLLDDVLTAVYNTIAVVFGMSKTDSVFGSIWGFLTDTYDEVVSWIKITWFNIQTTISETWTNIKNSAVKVFTDVKDWFVGLFTWASEGIAKGWTTATDFIKGIWDSIHSWFTGLWTWASDGIVKGWTTVTAYITGIWDTVVKWFKGLWAWGKKEGATEEGGFSLTKIIDAAFLKAKDWVVSIFKWSTAPVDAKDSWIAKTIKDVIALVQKWALSLFKWANTDEVTDPAGFSISGTVKKVIRTIIGWATGLFSWAVAEGTVDGEPWSLTKMIGGAIDKVIDWAFGKAKGLFAWGVKAGTTADGKEWSLTKFISEAFKKVTDWISGLLDFSPSKMLGINIPTFQQMIDAVLGTILPDPGSWVYKFLPSSIEDIAKKLMSGNGPGSMLPAEHGGRQEQINSAGMKRNAERVPSTPAFGNTTVNSVDASSKSQNTVYPQTPFYNPHVPGAVNLAS